MQKEILLQALDQNQIQFWEICNKITPENVDFQLNDETPPIGFIFRHIGEALSWYGAIFGLPADSENAKTNEAPELDIERSRFLVEQGFKKIKAYVENTPDSDWLEIIEAPLFGKISRARLFSRVLFHNSHHLGQVSLTLMRGEKID